MAQEHAGQERVERAGNDNRRQSTSTAEPVWRKAPSKPENPGFRQRWHTAQASKTAVFWLMAAAIALTLFIGFTWGGWVTGASAQRSATTTAQDAVVQRLAPICVAQFNQDPQKAERLVQLQEASSYQRSALVREHGWATMPGEETPDRKVAEACAVLLMAE